jgi:hypothetical protein
MPSRHVFFNAQDATGAGTALDVSKYRHIIVDIATDGGSDAALTCQCQGTLQTTAPTWTAGPTVDNMWDYIHMWDLENATGVDGDTGFVVATADDYRIFMINVDGLEWVNFRVTARTQGEVTVTGKAFSNL